jgi:DNA-binding transcriptional regulator/RsmH inhibitor MraZ
VSLANEKEAVVERLLGARSFQKSLDSYGRLVLPDDTLRMVRIEREAVLVGRLDKFEIWAPDNYHASLAKPEIRKIVLNTLKSKKI